MFKKKITMLIAAALMTLSASSAFAAFGNMNLYRVVLDNAGTVEIMTDLGNINTVLAGGKFGADANAFTAQAGGTKSTLNVTYFAVNNTATTKQLWISGGNSLAISAGKSATITSVTGSIFNYYKNLVATNGATNTFVGDPANGNSYHIKADSSTQYGQFGTAITVATRPGVEASLATLATSPVTQNLYYFANYAAASTGVKVVDASGNAIKLTTNADGSTTTPVANTPIPAAFYLMGSGLMGLVGLRRRNKA